MFKTFSKFISILLLTFLSIQVVGAVDYIKDSRYSFSIPSGWAEASEKELTQINTFLQENAGNTVFYPLSNAFRPTNQTLENYPYILIETHNPDSAPYKFFKTSFKEGLTITDDDLKGVKGNPVLSKFDVSNIGINETIVFKNKGLVLMPFQAKVGLIDVKGMGAIFINDNVALLLKFYSEQSTYSENLEKFQEIINTFNYKQDNLQYNSNQSLKPTIETLNNTYIDNVNIGNNELYSVFILPVLMALVLIGFIFWLYRKKIKDEDVKKDQCIYCNAEYVGKIKRRGFGETISYKCTQCGTINYPKLDSTTLVLVWILVIFFGIMVIWSIFTMNTWASLSGVFGAILLFVLPFYMSARNLTRHYKRKNYERKE